MIPIGTEIIMDGDPEPWTVRAIEFSKGERSYFLTSADGVGVAWIPAIVLEPLHERWGSGS